MFINNFDPVAFNIFSLDGKSKKHPFAFKDLEIFYSRGVGIFGESIYPIVWKGPS